MSKKKQKQNNEQEQENADILAELTEPLDLENATEPAPEKKEKQVQRKPRKGLGEELIEVYEATGDDLSSVTVLEHKRRTWKRMLVWILLFLVAVFVGVAAVSWFIWGGRQAFTGDQVQFDFIAPQEVTSGAEVEYLLHFANKEDISFRKAEVELRYPTGFIFLSADPEPRSGNNLWDLGTFASGQDGQITIKGRLVGQPERETTVSGMFRYWPANFSSEFAEVASAQTLIKPVAADLRLEAPEQILVGQKTSFSVVLANKQEQPISNLRLEAIYPSSFVVESSKPEIDEDGRWVIEELKPQEEREFIVDGYFSASEEEAQMIVLLSQLGRDEEYFKQKEVTQEIALIEGDLLSQLIVNGSSKDDTIQWGESLNVSVSYQNNSKTDLGDITAIVTIESRYRSFDAESPSAGAVDFSSLVDSARGSVKELGKTDGKTLHKRTITWTGEDIDSLDELAPNEEGELHFQMNLIDADTALRQLAHTDDVAVVLQVQMIVARTGEIEEELTVSTNPVTLNLDTDLVFDAHARYYSESGEELGYGPLPPEAGEETVYRVFWQLDNSIHEVKDIVVSAQLPNGVSWKNDYEVSAGEVSFLAASNDLTWALNRLPTDVQTVTFSFDVALRPSQTQIGEIASLTKKMTMTAQDSVTGGKIIQTVLLLTTAVDRDDRASDKGIVVGQD